MQPLNFFNQKMLNQFSPKMLFAHLMAFGCFFALLRQTQHHISMNTVINNKIYFTRPNKDKEASEDDIKQFEKTAIADVNRGKEVYIIEKFPKKFFYMATKIRIEKAEENVASLSALSNSRLFRVFSNNSLYE